MKREDPQECTGAQECTGGRTPLTVEPILINFIEFQLMREKYFTSTNLSELFNNIPSQSQFYRRYRTSTKSFSFKMVLKLRTPPSVILIFCIRSSHPFNLTHQENAAFAILEALRRKIMHIGLMHLNVLILN